MRKILKVVGLVVLALVVLLALVIVFVPINGYTILERIQARRELDKPLSPNYTATSYKFDFDVKEGRLVSKIVSRPASSLVDIKLNGSDQPIKVAVPASYTLSWTIDKSLLNGAYECSVYGKDETGALVEQTPSSSGEWKIAGAAFTRDREFVPNAAVIDIYTVACKNDQTIEMDEVEVWFTEATGQ